MRLLSQQGGEVPFQAADGLQALALAEERTFDAVLLDIMIPELDGLAVCRAIRRGSDVPIIFLTALSAEEERRQLTSHVAHELKTPLAVLHSYAEGLQEHIAEDKRDRYLEVILAETERMDALVLEMLDLSRLEAEKVKLAATPSP